MDEDLSADGRWQAYVASYVMVYPTEWARCGSVSVSLKRYVLCLILAWGVRLAGSFMDG